MQMIDQLYRDKKIDEACKKIAKGNDLWQDLKQELFIVLAEYDQDKLKEIQSKGQLMFFIVRILLNFYNSKTSQFYKKYKHINDEIIDLKYIKQMEDETYSDDLDKIELAFEKAKLTWYERGIAKLYIEEKSFRKLSAKLDIPTRSLCETMKDVKRKTHDIYLKINLNQ